MEILGTQVGKAYSLTDVAEFRRSAGIEDLDVETSDNVLWIGAGPHHWEPE
ncbi:hypothetical protein ABIA33_006983 [Streptacidiphilus sp. MAP12-16]|uniref:hypothetical protein n=1 Tax=Streptacidiphilus sp. MAP12-16 TaxID=3156300 RepID=UPI003517D074